MILGKTSFNLFARVADMSLYVTLSKEMGRQFLRNSQGLSPFGRHVI